MITHDNTQGLLRAIDDKVEKSLVEVAELVKDAAVAGAPEKTGDLKRGIRAEVGKNKVTVGSTVPYGAIQEVKQPHLRPALHGKLLAIRRIFRKT